MLDLKQTYNDFFSHTKDETASSILTLAEVFNSGTKEMMSNFGHELNLSMKNFIGTGNTIPVDISGILTIEKE